MVAGRIEKRQGSVIIFAGERDRSPSIEVRIEVDFDPENPGEAHLGAVRQAIEQVRKAPDFSEVFPHGVDATYKMTLVPDGSESQRCPEWNVTGCHKVGEWEIPNP